MAWPVIHKCELCITLVNSFAVHEILWQASDEGIVERTAFMQRVWHSIAEGISRGRVSLIAAARANREDVTWPLIGLWLYRAPRGVDCLIQTNAPLPTAAPKAFQLDVLNRRNRPVYQ